MKRSINILFVTALMISVCLNAGQKNNQQISIVVQDNQAVLIDKVTFEKLKNLSQAVRDAAASMTNHSLVMQGINRDELETILKLIRVAEQPVKLEKEVGRYTDLLALVRLYKQVRFLDIDVLNKAVHKQIINRVAQEKDRTKIQRVLNYFGSRNADPAQIKIVKEKIDDLFTIVLKDGLLGKELNEKGTIELLIKASQKLTDLIEDTDQQDVNVLYLQEIDVSTFEKLYQLIPLLADEESLEKALDDTKVYDPLALSSLFKAADFLEIKTLHTAALNVLAKNLATFESLVFFFNGRRWGSFLGLDKRLDSIVTQKILHLMRIELSYVCLFYKERSTSLNSVCWRSDGQQFAAGSDDNTGKIWDAVTGQFVCTLEGHSCSVNSIAWSPDGKRLATGSFDHTSKIWDAVTGQLVCTLEGHEGSVNSVSWSPDGKQLATGSDDETAKIWDAVTGQLVHTLEGHDRSVNSVSWRPDGKQLATGSDDETAKIWDAVTGQLVHTLEGHDRSVSSVSWSPDSKQLATGSEDDTAKIWDAITGQLVHTIEGHSYGVNTVAWSPNGKQLATGSYDKDTKIWDVATGSLLCTLEGSPMFGVNSVSWSPDGKHLATGLFCNGGEIWRVIGKHDLKDLTLDQVMLIILTQERICLKRPLCLSEELKQIYDTLSPILQEVLVKVFCVHV